MPHNQTFWDLVTTECIAIEYVATAVDVYLANSAMGEHLIGTSYTLDLAAAVEANVTALKTLKEAGPHEPSRRMAVHSALLMARPTKR